MIKPDDLKKAYKEGCSDVKKVLKNLFPDAELEEKTYSAGDRIRRLNDGGSDFIIGALADDHIVLIQLSNGNRWGDPMRVDNHDKIPEYVLVEKFRSKIELVSKRCE